MPTRNWQPYLDALKDGPLTPTEAGLRVFGPETDPDLARCNMQNAAKALQRMFRAGLIDRPTYGLYTLPGGRTAIPSVVDVYAALRRHAKRGARISDLMVDLDAGVDVVKKRLQRLRVNGFCRFTTEPDPVCKYARVWRYWALKTQADVERAFGENGVRRYRATGAALAPEVQGEIEFHLRALTPILRRAGVEHWVPTLVLRDPRTDARAVLTRDEVDVLAPPPGRTGPVHWTQRDPERAAAVMAAARARKKSA